MVRSTYPNGRTLIDVHTYIFTFICTYSCRTRGQCYDYHQIVTKFWAKKWRFSLKKTMFVTVFKLKNAKYFVLWNAAVTKNWITKLCSLLDVKERHHCLTFANNGIRYERPWEDHARWALSDCLAEKTYVHICTYVFIYVHMCSYMYICVHICTYVFIYVHMCSYMYICRLKERGQCGEHS
jgi:hypothetical protein